MKFYRFIIPIVVLSLLTPFFSTYADTLNQQTIFSVNSDYDRLSRSVVPATLFHIGDNAYFYVEDSFLNQLSAHGRSVFQGQVESLAREFDNLIYPKETMVWGSEPRPGIDSDPKITVLLQQLKRNVGGYFDDGNLQPKRDVPDSNQREMVAVSVDAAVNGLAKGFLAHEFQHLISFNQKNLIRNISEEVWLNEVRSQYAPTVAGYNDVYAGSDLEQRIQLFRSNPFDSLTEWPNTTQDYALATLFGHYLVEQYGQGILGETIKSSRSGIDSINEYLQNQGYKERFADVFGNWVITSMLNDQSRGRQYGYTRNELKSIQLNPRNTVTLAYPNTSESAGSLKPWEIASYRHNIASDQDPNKVIKIDVPAPSGFQFAYYDNLGRVGTIYNSAVIDNPGGLQYFVIIPVNATKTSGFAINESTSNFSILFSYEDAKPAKLLIQNGMIIRRTGSNDLYVVEEKYKRYLRFEVIALYGHLDPAKAVEVDIATFDSYNTANYVRNMNDKKVYAVWPDGTKHWLNMSAEYFTQSGRDWGAIFIINDLESNFYRAGEDIRR